jgi:phospholipid-binding lipoprotein MlaA
MTAASFRDGVHMIRLPLFRHVALLALTMLATACANPGGGVRSNADAANMVQAEPTQAAMPAPPPGASTDTPADAMPADDTAMPDADVAAANATAVGTQAAPDTGATGAEQDGAAIYGQDVYNPIYDPTLPSPAQMPASYDPWEKWNRHVHAFNNGVDRTIAKPLAKAYVKVVPRPVRLGVGNFFNNLGQPVSALNALLQGKPKQAGESLGRFLVNTTIGVAGIFDPATRFRIPSKSEDFGQTLGVWGWRRSRFVELPLFGPRTVRDTFGLVGDGPLAPVRYVEDDRARVFLQGLQLVDVRTQLFAVDSLREGAADEYALVRDSWLQRRNYQIVGDSGKTDDQSLPDYLRDTDDNPGVPADAMPIIPGSATP